MSNINYLKHIKLFCRCEEINNKIKIVKYKNEDKSENETIDIKDFFDYENFKRCLEYGKELLDILNFGWFERTILTNKEENEKIINIYIKMCNDIGFVCSNNVNFNEHNKITLGIKEIKIISYKVIKLYMLYELYVGKRKNNLKEYEVELFKRFLLKFGINKGFYSEKMNTYYTINTDNIEKKLIKIIRKDINKYSKYMKVEVTEENEILLSSYDLYVLGLYAMLDYYLDYETTNDKNIFICPKCKRKVRLNNDKIRNITLCERCRKEDTKRKNKEYYKKKKLVNELEGYRDIVNVLSDFDMKEYETYVNSISNKKRGIEKKTLKEINNYLDKVRKIINCKN